VDFEQLKQIVKGDGEGQELLALDPEIKNQINALMPPEQQPEEF